MEILTKLKHVVALCDNKIKRPGEFGLACLHARVCIFIFPAACRLFQLYGTITSRRYLGLGQNTESTRNNTT